MSGERILYDSIYMRLSKTVKLMEAENECTNGFQGLRHQGNGELLFSGYKVSVKLDEYILEICHTHHAYS